LLMKFKTSIDARELSTRLTAALGTGERKPTITCAQAYFKARNWRHGCGEYRFFRIARATARGPFPGSLPRRWWGPRFRAMSARFRTSLPCRRLRSQAAGHRDRPQACAPAGDADDPDRLCDRG